MFWWTGCVGCGPTCGGRRRRSEPERAGGEQAGALGLHWFGGARWQDGGRGSRRCGRGLGRWVAAPLVVRSRPLSCGGGSSDFASTRKQDRKPTPATAATGLRRPPHQQNHRSRLWRLVAAVAAFCVPTTPAAPGTPPRLACRSRQTAGLAAAAFAAASPSLSIWGGVGVPVPQLAALCAGTPRTPGGLRALRPKGLLCPAADTAGPSWRSGGSPQRRSGSRSNGAPQPEARPRAPPTEPSGSLFQRSLPRQQQQDGGGAAVAAAV